MFEVLLNHDFGLFYVVSQFFAATGTILALISMQQKKKIQILNFNTLASASAVLHYLFLGAWAGVATKLVSTTRNITAAYEAHNHKTSRILPLIFVGFYVVSGILTFESAFSLLPMMGTVVFTIVIYFGNAKTIRYGAGFASLMWLIYNIYTFSVVGIVSEMIFIANDLIAIWRYRDEKNKKKNRKNKTRR